MDGKTSDVIGVRLECGDLFMSVVVEDPKLEVVGASDEPIFARNEFYTAYGNLCDFERLDERTSLMVVDINGAVIKSSE